MSDATDDEHPLQETCEQMATPDDRRRQVIASEGGQSLAFLWDRTSEVLVELRDINSRLGSHSAMLRSGQDRMDHMDRDIEKAQKLGKGLIVSVLASAIALILSKYFQGGGS